MFEYFAKHRVSYSNQLTKNPNSSSQARNQTANVGLAETHSSLSMIKEGPVG